MACVGCRLVRGYRLDVRTAACVLSRTADADEY